MTPKFTTNCILITKDETTINYVVQKLIEMGRRDFTTNGFGVDKTKAILAFNDCFTLSMNKSCPPTVERCIDIATFLDLAGMRADTWYKQYVIALKDYTSINEEPIKNGELFRNIGNDSTVQLSKDMRLIRRATATEIINHHKQKGE